MDYTLEEKIGISMKHINMLAEIATTTGVCITEYDSPDDFFAAYLKTISFEMLHEMTTTDALPMQGKIKGMMQAEMKRRVDKAMAQ